MTYERKRNTMTFYFHLRSDKTMKINKEFKKTKKKTMN